MADINELRKEVARLEANAARKMRRMRASGIDTGSVSPVRPGKAKRYTVAQLQGYSKSLSSFNSRDVQFVPGVRGAPLPKKDWERYKAKEAQHVSNVNERYHKYAGDRLPSSVDKNGNIVLGQTIDDRMKIATPKHAVSGSANAPAYKPIERNSADVTTAKALKALEKDLDRRLKPRHVGTSRRKTTQRQIEPMITVLGKGELAESVKGLTSEQFYVLWNFTSFASALGMNYANAQRRIQGEPVHEETDKFSDRTTDLLVRWVKETYPKK